ncbi:MAG: alpha-2-macroglobulin family protein [bacterium]
MLESPFQSAVALVIVEGPDQNIYQRVAVRGGQAVVEVPIDRSYAPRVPVHVVLLRGRSEAPEPAGDSTADLGRPDLVATTTWLAVAPVDHQVQVAVTLPETALPGQQIPLDLRLTDPRGQPIAGEVTLWLVDQAVLDLGTEQPLDAIPDFLIPRRSEVGLRDTRKLALGRIPYTQMPGGGDGDDDDDPLAQATIRRDFRPVPYYEPALQVGPNGQARIQITLPDNLTRFAVRAKAISGDRFGYATGHIDVRLPVLAQAVLPRFVRPGDEVVAGVIGRVVEGPIGAGAAQLDVEGATVVGEAKAALEFGADKLARAGFRLRVGDASDRLAVTLGVRREADGAADAALIELPVRPDRRPESRAGIVALPVGGQAEVPGVGDDVRPGTLERRLVVTDQPALLRAAGALDGLAQRPGGSTGARIARARALLAGSKLRESLGFLGDDLIRDAIRGTLDHVGQSVDGDGRVAPFPGTPGQVHLTAAAVLLLAEARAAGFPPPRRLWDRLTETLRQALRSDYTGFVQGAAWVERGAALEALAAAGRLDAGYLDELGRVAGSLGPEASARAILAARKGGVAAPPALAEGLRKAVRTELKGGQTVYAGLAGFDAARDPVLRADETTAIAAVARALQAAKPDDDALPVLTATLLRLADAGGFGSPEADAEALLALQEIPAQGSGGGLEVAFAGDGAPAPLVLAPEAPLVLSRLEAGGPLTARLTRGGPAELAWWTRHVPAGPGAEAPAATRGFVISRTWRRVQAGDVPAIIAPVAEAGATLPVKIGEVIEEDVQLVNPEDRVYVAVELPLAAGLEPLNPALATAPPEARTSHPPTLAPDYAQILDDRAIWYFLRLPRGTYHLYLRTRATTAGRYQQPGAAAEALFDQAIFGQSPGARVDVQP